LEVTEWLIGFFGQIITALALKAFMNTRTRVFFLRGSGLKPSEIAHRVGVSKQRVYQILSASSGLEPGKPGRRPSPPEDRERKFPPREGFKQDRIPQVKEILSERDDWTWAEADSELQRRGLKPPATKINTFLRELGFSFDRRKKRWLRQRS
jgi:transposase